MTSSDITQIEIIKAELNWYHLSFSDPIPEQEVCGITYIPKQMVKTHYSKRQKIFVGNSKGYNIL